MKYNVVAMTAYGETFETVHSFDQATFAHSTHLKLIMLELDAQYADMVSITVLPKVNMTKDVEPTIMINYGDRSDVIEALFNNASLSDHVVDMIADGLDENDPGVLQLAFSALV